MRGHRYLNYLLLTLVCTLAFSACGLNYELRIRTLFRPWPGPLPGDSELRAGDVVLRLVESPQSAVLAGLGLNHFSHGGIVFYRDGSPWIVDCMGVEPRAAVKAEPFEDFLASKRYANRVHISKFGPLPIDYSFDFIHDHQVIHYMVLRLRRPLDPDRFERTLENYLYTPTDYDSKYLLDNDRPNRRRLYCTEFIWRFIRDASGEDLGLPLQSKETTLKNIGLIEDLIFRPEIMAGLEKLYGRRYIEFMLKIGRRDQRNLEDLPPGAGIIFPQAFMLSSRFAIVRYQASRPLLKDLNKFYGHFKLYQEGIRKLKEGGPPSAESIVGLSARLARTAGQDNPAYYLRDILVRPGRPSQPASRNENISRRPSPWRPKS